MAVRLDSFYGADGEIIAWRDRLVSGQRSGPNWRKRLEHCYPANYTGPIYMRLFLPRESLPNRVRLTAHWGPWRLSRSVIVEDEQGVLMHHMKGDDGLRFLSRSGSTAPAL